MIDACIKSCNYEGIQLIQLACLNGKTWTEIRGKEYNSTVYSIYVLFLDGRRIYEVAQMV